MGHKELNIVLQRDINVYLHHALPLSVILSDEKLIPWFYEHYIEIFSQTYDNGYITADFLEYWSPYRTLCEEVHMGVAFLAQVRDIADYVIDKINMDYYVSISLDEYYIPNKREYREWHATHSSLLYGYDDDKRTFLAMGFDENKNFTKITIGYDDFATAYEGTKLHYKESSPWCETEVIEMLKLWEFKNKYPFNLSVFLPKLHNYINCVRDDSVAFSRMHIGRESRIKYGLNVYDDFVNHLEGKNKSDYRFIHLLYESKKAINDRLLFINANYCLTEPLKNGINSYSDIVKKIDMARKMYTKIQQYTEVGKENDKEVKKLISLIEALKDEEKALLLPIYNGLKDNPPQPV